MLRAALVLTVTALALLATATSGHAATFNPVADTYVDASKPTSTYGFRSYLRIDGSPVRTAYLRFNVQGVANFSSARLRLYVEAGSSVGFDVRSVSNTTWNELTTNYNNAPAFGPVIASTGPVNSGSWVTLDVSSLVASNGLVSLALTTSHTTAIKITSRQGANQPELLVPAPGSPSPFVVTRNGLTYQAMSVPNGTTYTGTLKSVVESAVNDLKAHGGGTVSFASGTFDLGSDYFDLNDAADLTFEGQGMNATVIQNSSSAAGDTEPFNFSGASNITIRNLTVSAGGPFRSTSDAIDFDNGSDSLVENVKITGSRARGIIFDGKNAGWSSQNNVVRNCVITGIPSDGIELLASTNNRIEGCTITNVGGHGIQITKSSTQAAQPNKKSNDNVVTGNTIDNAGQDGIDVLSSDRNTIVDNMITNSSDATSGRDGIRIDSFNGVTCDDNVVETNVATDNQTVKTQAYGLNILDPLCNRTVVTDNNFVGNLVGEIKDLGTNTQITSNDTQPPSAPTDLASSALQPTSVHLTWSPSTDNVGVALYTIYRNTVAIATVDGTTTQYDDLTLSPETTYSYYVTASDAVPNESGPSNQIQVTTPAGGGGPVTLTFTPDADAYVNASKASSNYGSSTALRTDASPDIRSYVRFTVTGIAGTVTSAKLRIYANSGSSVGFTVSGVTGPWEESTVTYNNAPGVGTPLASSGSFSSGAYVEVDVTAHVQSLGNGTYDLALTTTHTTAISLGSRESSNSPELVVDVN